MGNIRHILIANRGEITSRVVRTAKRLGIHTTAIYAEDDRYLPFVTEADNALCLGKGALKDTYLAQEKIIAIAKETGADAIHPGYGFLSENAGFAQKVMEAGLTFIGPSPDIIRLMGDKIEARKAAVEAGVPVIPGYDGDVQDEAALLQEAECIGFPLLIKASAGGGGKGMRVVERAEDFVKQLSQARAEAENAFSDGRVFLERYILSPRHIEVQVFSDTHGNHIHLFERECSIQRRHQKMVEETPSVALDDALRQMICETAVHLSSHIGYVGAGTVEFMLAPSGEFFFLEMNTRLQVEHSVTEMVVGADLVEWQIAVAEDKPLPRSQAEVAQQGHAIEVRIYAEDPDNNFLPTTGVVQQLGLPLPPFARLDNTYTQGNVIGVGYDPMLAKLTVWGNTREEARRDLLATLARFWLTGVKTNRAYLARILQSSAFIHGETFTDFVEKEKEALKPQPFTPTEKAAVVELLLRARLGSESGGMPYELIGFRNV